MRIITKPEISLGHFCDFQTLCMFWKRILILQILKSPCRKLLPYAGFPGEVDFPENLKLHYCTYISRFADSIRDEKSKSGFIFIFMQNNAIKDEITWLPMLDKASNACAWQGLPGIPPWVCSCWRSPFRMPSRMRKQQHQCWTSMMRKQGNQCWTGLFRLPYRMRPCWTAMHKEAMRLPVLDEAVHTL